MTKAFEFYYLFWLLIFGVFFNRLMCLVVWLHANFHNDAYYYELNNVTGNRANLRKISRRSRPGTVLARALLKSIFWSEYSGHVEQTITRFFCKVSDKNLLNFLRKCQTDVGSGAESLC